MRTADGDSFAGFVLQRAQKRVLRSDGTEVPLTPRLFNALALFVDHAGELLDKDLLMRSLWPGLVVEENNLSQTISGLRRALGDDAQGSRFIQTVPRRGYRFVAPVTPWRAATGAGPARGETPAAAPGDASTVAPSDSALASPGISGPTPTAWPSAPPIDAGAAGRRRAMVLSAAAGVAGALGLGGWAWQRQQVVPDAPGVTSLAVLPFAPLTAADRDELLELGMADSLVTRLSTVPGLVVRSTTSVLRFGGVGQDPLRAARELDVDWIVDGTLLRRGDTLRATARLLRAADGSAAWSASFDEKFDDIFRVQDQIAERVTQALAAVLPAGNVPPAPMGGLGGTLSTDAYQLYLAAAWRAQGTRGNSTDKAIGLLRQALSIDPAYAQAWTLLAWTHRRRLWRNDAPPSEVFEASDAAVAQALRLAPNLAQAHAGKAFSRYWYAFDWPGGESEFRAALALNPNEVSARWGLAQMLLVQGRIDEGFAHLRQARVLDPMSPVFNTLEAGFLIDQGRLDEARTRLNRAFDIAPGHGLALHALAMLRLAEHQPDEAIAALRRAAGASDGTTHPRAVLAAQLALHGGQDEARAILGELQARSAQRFVPPTFLAMVHAGLGETVAALAALERAHAVRDTRLVYLNVDHVWDPIRGEPRFAALMRKLRMDRFGRGLATI